MIMPFILNRKNGTKKALYFDLAKLIMTKSRNFEEFYSAIFLSRSGIRIK